MKKLDKIAKNSGGGENIYNIKNKFAFTLVELIITIVILVILSTIGFLSFGNYTSIARDTVRKNDFINIQKALELYYLKNGEYPKPEELSQGEDGLFDDKYVGFTYGKIGENLGGILNFSKIPVDPLTKKYYKYSLSDDGEIYMMKLELENEGSKIYGNVAINCQDLKTKGLFRGNGKYMIFHQNIEPREVYCHENYSETFLLSAIGGNMEIIQKNSENNQNYATFYEGIFKNTNVSFTTEDKYSGERSLKISGRDNFLRSDYVYIDSNKKYKMSGWIKILETGPRVIEPAIYFGLDTYSLVDGEIVSIPGAQKFAKPGTETVLTRDLSENQKVIYFNCDYEKYKNFRDNLDAYSIIAFDVDNTGNLSDLPNKNLSNNMWNWRIPGKRSQIPNYLKVNGENVGDGLSTWGENKTEVKTCSLESDFEYGKNYSRGTWIRLHDYYHNTKYAVSGRQNNFNNWYYVEGYLGKGTQEEFSKFDNFAKLHVYLNYGGDSIGEPEISNTVTYLDDFEFKVID